MPLDGRPWSALALWLATASPVAAAAPLATASPPPEDTTPYQILSGDTLSAVAQRYLTHRSDASAVKTFNHIRNDRHLRIGSTLNIPTALLRTEPLDLGVDSFSGPVTVTIRGVARPAARALRLHEGDRVATGPDAFVSLGFSDGTRMSLPSQTSVIISALHHVVLGDAVNRRIRIDRGRSDYDVTPLRHGRDRFEVSTPGAVAAVRGTEFRVGYDETLNRSVLEVLGGRVAERGASTADGTLVAEGEAAVRGAEGRILVKLPAAPALSSPGRTQNDEMVVFSIAGPATGGQYHVQLASDAGFTDLFAETMADAGVARFSGVKNGALFVRATRIDDHGVEGLPVVYSFERRRSTLEAGVAPPPAGARHKPFAFKWRGAGEGQMTYRFVLARDAALKDRIVDEAGLTGAEITVIDLPPGAYYWQVGVTQRADGKTFGRALKINSLIIADPKAK